MRKLLEIVHAHKGRFAAHETTYKNGKPTGGHVSFWFPWGDVKNINSVQEDLNHRLESLVKGKRKPLMLSRGPGVYELRITSMRHPKAYKLLQQLARMAQAKERK